MQHAHLLSIPVRTPSAHTAQNIMRVAAVACALVTSVTPMQAQDPGPPAVDSLRQRLEDLEATVEMLREQLATESGAAVRTRSRAALELRGRVLMNSLFTSGRTNNVDVPLVAAASLPEQRPGGGTITLRQTMLGFAVTAPDVAGAHFTGDLDVDFFGGQVASTGGRHFPLLRLRTARATLAWNRVTLMAGQETPLIADIDPVSLASVGTPGFTTAGNLWLWLPQVRATVETPGAVRVAFQGAVLAPTPITPQTAFNTSFDAAERSRMPSLQARLSVRWGSEESAAEVGIGVHRGRARAQADSVERHSEAIAVSASVPFLNVFEFRGEAFDGQLLSGLGGGGIGQGFSDDGRPVRARGGWGQLNVRPNARWILGIGSGVDAANVDDVPAVSARIRNDVDALHAQWTPTGPLLFGFEYRRIRTAYRDAARQKAHHINVAVGFQF